MGAEHRWLLLTTVDAALLAGLGWLVGLPILYPLAPLSCPLWAWVDSKPEGRALIRRLWP